MHFLYWSSCIILILKKKKNIDNNENFEPRGGPSPIRTLLAPSLVYITWFSNCVVESIACVHQYFSLCIDRMKNEVQLHRYVRYGQVESLMLSIAQIKTNKASWNTTASCITFWAVWDSTVYEYLSISGQFQIFQSKNILLMLHHNSCPML